jgi:hypothetical protein
MHAFGIFSDQDLILSQPAILRETYKISTQSVMVFSNVEMSVPGFSAMELAVYGNGVSMVTAMPADYKYTDYMLFVRP